MAMFAKIEFERDKIQARNSYIGWVRNRAHGDPLSPARVYEVLAPGIDEQGVDGGGTNMARKRSPAECTCVYRDNNTRIKRSRRLIANPR